MSEQMSDHGGGAPGGADVESWFGVALELLGKGIKNMISTVPSFMIKSIYSDGFIGGASSSTIAL